MSLKDEPGSFYVVSDNMQKYAEMAKEKLSININADSSGSDHFINTMREISELEKIYENESMEKVMNRLCSSAELMSWVSIIFSMIIFGKTDGNSIEPVTIHFSNAPYLKVWKNKFQNGDNDAENISNDGLNVYEFIPGDVTSMAGCYSNKYFVIPPKEVTRDNAVLWKKFYHMLMDSANFQNALNNDINEIYKIMLMLSANSMPDNTPLRIIKAIIFNCISLNSIFDIEEELPHKVINNISFFSTNLDYIVKNPFTDDIYLVSSENRYFSLYPFSNQLIGYIEKGRCVISKIRIKIPKSNNMVILFTDINYYITFFGDKNQEKTALCKIALSKKYEDNHIKEIVNLGTFCMYPDIPLEYENRCSQYIYLSNEASVIESDNMYNDRISRVYIPKNILNNIPGSSETAMLRYNIRLNFISSPKQHHIIKINDSDNNYTGCILNLRTLSKNYPAFLSTENVTNISLLADSIHVNKNSNMYAYVDFGNSTSAVGYRINNGVLQTDDIKGGEPLIRKLLTVYDKKSYSIFINSSDDYKLNKIPSYLINYDSYDLINDFLKYSLILMPLTGNISETENAGLQISIDFKPKCSRTVYYTKTGSKYHYDSKCGCGTYYLCVLDEAVRMGLKPCKQCIFESNMDKLHIMIFNLCYIAVYNAVTKNCSNIFIFPTFQNEKCYNTIYSIWSLVIDKVRDIFSVNVINMLKCNKKYLLYDSVASIEDIKSVGNNVVITNVHMGDSGTDMSAIFIDKFGSKKLCAYSSVSYGGKNLLTSVVSDMLSHIELKQDAETFFFGTNGKKAFINFPESDEYSKNIAKKICLQFFLNNKRKGKPRNKNWHYYFSHLLDRAKVNTSTGDNAMDIKARADLLFRYAVLMPVIKDFILKAFTLCDSDENTVVSIEFSGGASQGLIIADEITDKRFFSNIKDYFRSSFRLNDLSVSDNNPKKQIIEKINEYSISVDDKGIYNIDTSSDLLSVLDSKVQVHINSSGSLFNDFDKYISEIIARFIPDENMSQLFKNSFVDSPAESTRNETKAQLSQKQNGSSLILAEESEIYSEMMRNTAYMFEAVRLIANHFGKGFSESGMSGNVNEEYRFTN